MGVMNNPNYAVFPDKGNLFTELSIKQLINQSICEVAMAFSVKVIVVVLERTVLVRRFFRISQHKLGLKTEALQIDQKSVSKARNHYFLVLSIIVQS